MIRDTILIAGSLYVSTMLPELATGIALLGACSVGVLALALDRSSRVRAS